MMEHTAEYLLQLPTIVAARRKAHQERMENEARATLNPAHPAKGFEPKKPFAPSSMVICQKKTFRNSSSQSRKNVLASNIRKTA